MDGAAAITYIGYTSWNSNVNPEYFIACLCAEFVSCEIFLCWRCLFQLLSQKCLLKNAKYARNFFIPAFLIFLHVIFFFFHFIFIFVKFHSTMFFPSAVLEQKKRRHTSTKQKINDFTGGICAQHTGYWKEFMCKIWNISNFSLKYIHFFFFFEHIFYEIFLQILM